MAAGDRGGRRRRRRDPAYIEQYRIFVQSADNASSRRVSINRYQASLNLAVVAAYGIAETVALQPLIQMLAAVVGIIISLNWLYTIRSLRKLNREKFKIIQEMESELPRAIFTVEWNRLGRGPSAEKAKWWPPSEWPYRGANFFENQVPAVFACLHVASLAHAIYQWMSDCPLGSAFAPLSCAA